MNNTILYKGKGGIQHEAQVVTAALRPGMLVKRSLVSGVESVQPNNTAGAVPSGVVRDNALDGGTVDTVYAVGSRVLILQVQPGEQYWARVPVNAAAIVYDDDLQADANGFVVKRTTGVSIGKARSDAPNNATSEQWLLVEAMMASVG